MIVINARNVNDALWKGIKLIHKEGVEVDSRNGKTLEVPCPVTTVYHNPWERVLINQARDANPFFHMFESLWILAGRRDVKFLCGFNKRMVDYSDDGKVFNAPYGYRLRTQFHDAASNRFDQLTAVINILRQDPNSRQAVCQIWDTADLEKDTKDKACNMSIVFRIRNNHLYMTVYNRSNDMIWGAYGANVVQFSMIQEYVAMHLNIPMGYYTQVSNSFHVYTEGPGGKVWDKIKDVVGGAPDPYVQSLTTQRMGAHSLGFEHDLKLLFNRYDKGRGEDRNYISDYFKNLVIPMIDVYTQYKRSGPTSALQQTNTIVATDWRVACKIWLKNRVSQNLGEYIGTTGKPS